MRDGRYSVDVLVGRRGEIIGTVVLGRDQRYRGVWRAG
jgi:hypothetical protein